MLALTLLAIEGMARLAYYAAYGQGYGRGGLGGLIDIPPPPPQFLARRRRKLTKSAP